MVVSINTNIAAYYAQANIQTATDLSQSNVSRLSSGNAVVRASDNVAALATGTSLATEVSALRTAQTNAAQGSSLLQVADSALGQIQSILQQQRALALQSQSGALTNTVRGFLNQQFQALKSEIDILAVGTTFNGVALIDGSIATGGSNNPLQNSAIVTSATTISPSGFTDRSNSAYASTTYQTGSFTAGAATFTAATTITQPTGSTTYDKSLYGTLASAGTFTVNAVGGVGSITAYTIDYTAADGTVYRGSLTANGTSGVVAAGVSVTLTATTNAADHATITLTTGASGFAGTSDNSITIEAGLAAHFNTIAYTSGSFDAAPVITQATSGLADASLYGDLSQGSFTIEFGTDANTTVASTAATGYIVSYTLNGTTYKGFLAASGVAGQLGIANTGTVTLSSGDDVNHATIRFDVNTQFGASLTGSVDQRANIKSALEANVAGATALYTAKAATVSGEATQTGISAVTFTNNPTKNDTAFIGDLSAGNFTVTGDTVVGYSVSYALNGSTYQGRLSAAQIANGGKLVLAGVNGSLSFTISSSNASTASSTALDTALTAQFAGATAYAIHKVKSDALATDTFGNTIAGSALRATDTAGGLLNGFDGSDITLQSALYDGAKLPTASSFTSEGFGANTVLSVIINGERYSTSTNVAVGSPTVLNGATWTELDGTAGTAGHIFFYKNGDYTSKEYMELDLSGISTSLRIDTADNVAQVTDALNTAFGSVGGSAGGLTFQLGTNASSNVTINIASAKTTALYEGSVLDISTASGATAAAGVVATAIDTVTSLRAGVGAVGSQFNFASAAIQASIQNQDAARGVLLDTDITSESTAYATNQVKLQAGISVLAQANQQLQALLKLIG